VLLAGIVNVCLSLRIDVVPLQGFNFSYEFVAPSPGRRLTAKSKLKLPVKYEPIGSSLGKWFEESWPEFWSAFTPGVDPLNTACP
jgi:hypothetical protein